MTHLRLKLQFLEFKKAFLKFDTDGNGYITKSELKKAMKELGEKLSKEELADMMNEGNCLTLRSFTVLSKKLAKRVDFLTRS